MKTKVFKSKFLCLLLAMVMMLGLLPAKFIQATDANTVDEATSNESSTSAAEPNSNAAPTPDAAGEPVKVDTPADNAVPVEAPSNFEDRATVNANEIYLDSVNGDDINAGSPDKPVKTFNKALEILAEAGTLNVVNLSESNISVNKKVTLKFLNDVTMTGTGTGIDLAEGSHLTVADGKKLTMSGYNTAINVKKGAEINDGDYVFKFAENGFAFVTSGNIVGTSKAKLKMNITNGYFEFNSADSEFKNATMNQKYEGEKWQLYEWNGFKVINSEINLCRLPVYFKGPLYMDNSKFTIDGKGVNYQTGAYFENSWTNGTFHFTNNSIFEVKNFNTHWRAKGITFGYGNKVLVENGAKIIVKNNGNGGLNANEGIATFNGGYIEGDGHSGSLFGAQDNDNTKIVFGADSVVNTPMKADSDNGLGQTGTNYIVTGGSHKVFYAPNYHSGKAIPVNGEENGNEKLTWFKLNDNSVEKLNPINKNGQAYEYSVKNASDDGNKYVWTPAAKVTFKLNNNDASFSDKTTADKILKTIRGYKLDDVAGNTEVGDPTDKNGVNFLGWFYKTASGEEKEFSWDEKLTTDTEAYAKWEAKTVIYHNGQGKNYIASKKKEDTEAEVLAFDEIVKAQADFKVEGKQFTGWTSNPDGTGAEYKAGDKVTFAEGKTQIDLYAKYTDSEYTVKFSANGGTFSADSVFKQNKDVFTLEKDANDGDVAVLNKKAKYNDNLFDLLGTLDHNQLKPDTNATKTGFVLANPDYFYKNEEAGHGSIRFDDYTSSFFGLTLKGKNPKIIADTTYYLAWKVDSNTETKSVENISLDSDMYGADAAKTTKAQPVYKDKEFSLTGAVNVASIKQQMSGIELIFNKQENDFAKITLTGAKSTFTAKLTLPNEIEIPKNPQVVANGLGDCFELGKTEVKGQKVIVTFKLKAGMTNYQKLKAAVNSTGAAIVAPSLITLTVNGLKLKDFDKLKDGQKLTATGDVTGNFSAVAKFGDTRKRFSFTWKGKQTKDGKDDAATDNSIQYTFIVSKPTELTLGGDLLVKKGNEAYDTVHSAPYSVSAGDNLTFEGKLNVSSIKDKIKLLKEEFDKNNNNSSDTITTKDIKSEFTATLTLPEGLTLPETARATLTDNNLFEIKNGDVKVEGKKISVKMTLKKSYTTFSDLFKDVTSVSDTLDLEVPNIKVADTAAGNLTVKGEVIGTFVGTATAGTKEKVFNYQWTAEQTESGKDCKQAANDNKTIQLTLQVPNCFTLGGDILIGEDTGHDALHKVKNGELLEYTGRLDVSSIKNQIKALKDEFDNNNNNESDTITTKGIKSEFTATLTLPEGLTLPETARATLTDNNLFEIKNGDVKVEGKKISVKMTLKKSYTTFSALYTDVQSVPFTLDLKVPNIKVGLTATGNLTVKGEVVGTFTGTATAGNKTQTFNYRWVAEQIEAGKDFAQAKGDDKTIQYTVAVGSSVVIPEPKQKPEPKPTYEPSTEPAPLQPKRGQVVKTGESKANTNTAALLVLVIAGLAALCKKKQLKQDDNN